MSTSEARRLARVGEMVLAVARQLLLDRGAARLVLLDDGSPEVELAFQMLSPLGEACLIRVSTSPPQVESVLHSLGVMNMSGRGSAEEVTRLACRLVPDSISACAANKTALLLGGELPPEPFLPLGDLYASEVESLCGAWSAPAAVREMARDAGGIQPLDAALRARFDARDPGAFQQLPEHLRDRIAAVVSAGAAARSHPRLVPKLGSRTLGVDLNE